MINGQLRMKATILGVFMLAMSLSCTCNKQYQPTGDINAILSLNLPSPIDTLAEVARDEMYSSNGVNVLSSNSLKETFTIKQDGTTYVFRLFADEASAQQDIAYFKNKLNFHGPIAEVKEASRNSVVVHFTEENCEKPHSLLCHCDNTFNTYAEFQVRNLVVMVWIAHSAQLTNELTNSAKFVAEVVSANSQRSARR